MRRLRDAADPHPLYRELLLAGPVCPNGLGGLLVIGRGHAEQVLTAWPVPDREWMRRHRPDWLLSPLRQFMAGTALNTNEPLHARMRGNQARHLTARRVSGLRPAIAGYVTTALDRFAETVDAHGAGDFTAVADQVPMRVVADLLGLPQADVPRLCELVQVIGAGNDLAPRPSTLAAADRAAGELEQYLKDRGTGATPLAESFTAAGQDEFGTAGTYLTAGTETTSTLFGHLLVYWLRYRPDTSTPAARTAVITEVLRLEPPATAVSRYAPHDGELAGHTMRAGQIALVIIIAANRDPAWVSDPHAFRPGRPERGLAFGHGPHFCLGAALARLKADVVLELLPRYARRWALGSGGVSYGRNMLMRRITALPILLDRDVRE